LDLAFCHRACERVEVTGGLNECGCTLVEGSHHHCVAQTHTTSKALFVMHTQPSVFPPSTGIVQMPLALPVQGVVHAAPLAAPATQAVAAAGAE
jgi:hypothetical protein